MKFRSAVGPSDPAAVGKLVAATGFFSRQEQSIAVELADSALTQGTASGYEFLFADMPGASGRLAGYVCYGPIPATASSFDVYWIVVDPSCQGAGLGRRLLAAAEVRAKAQGAQQMFVDTAGRAQYAPTRAFYERVGYRKAAVLENFYAPGDAKVIFAKDL
jgi:ribosomal protein S18 acetylase RimI-like enzyme